MKTKIINFYGAPSSSKSTKASCLYSELKLRGISCELVTEYAKEWAWEHREIKRFDQIYIVSNQIHRETRLMGQVEYIITDSPVPLGCFYDEYKYKNKILRPMISEFLKYRKQLVDEFNFWLPVNKDWISEEGRFHALEQIYDIDTQLKNFLETFDPKIELLKWDENSLKEIKIESSENSREIPVVLFSEKRLQEIIEAR